MRSAMYKAPGMRYQLALLSAILLLVSPGAIVPAVAVATDGSASSLQRSRSDELAEAKRLHDQAITLYRAGKYDEAIPLAERALAIREKALGPDHPDVATSLDNLAGLLRLYAISLHVPAERKVPLGRAKALYQRSLAIREKALGTDHPYVAESLDHLAKMVFDKAEPLYLRSIAIREKAFGSDHPVLATALTSLAEWYSSFTSNYAKAEPLYLRALAIREKALGPDHPDVATSLDNLAGLYRRKGDYAKAEPLYLRLIAIREKAFGSDYPVVVTALFDLAALYQAKRDYPKAEPLYLRALAIQEKGLGSHHRYVATSLDSLAELYTVMGDYAKAEPLYQRSLAIREKNARDPADDPAVARSLDSLAKLYQAKGDYAKAELLYQRSRPILEKALASYEKSFGSDSPVLVKSLNTLADFYEAKDDVTRAVAFRRRATDVTERNIALNLATGSERQKRLYLEGFSGETDRTVSLHVQSAPSDQAARRLALTTILRRKGRALDAVADSIGALRRRLNPQDRALLDQLTETRSRLATLVLGGPGQTSPAQHRAEIKRFEEQADKLEAQVSSRSAEFRVQSQPVTLESVQASIPPDAALVEFVSYYPYNAKKNKSGSRSYVAYVLSNQGEPSSVDLGEAAAVDRLVNELRAVLRKDEDKPLSEIEQEIKPKARLLDQKIMQPVRKLLGDKRKLLVSPDGALNLIPFAALVDEQGKYLIESYSLTYLTTGRDLLRLQTRMENKQGATLFANPDFGGDITDCKERALKIAKKTSKVRETINFSDAFFCPLEGTADEAKALKTIFPDAVVWTQAQATKTQLKQVNAPAFLHVATHGFFLDDVVITAESRGLVHTHQSTGEITTPEFHVEDPLLRSGLAFAGANLHRGGDDDGILTAKEASGLNLWGTKLVVLSACDTGVGEVKNGEGVYGLRRALVLAGSETQVMSLWPVSDEGTRDLMIDYYKALKAGQGRSEGLRQVQLKMLASKNRQHPYYWASFIQSGEWANLDGKR